MASRCNAPSGAIKLVVEPAMAVWYMRLGSVILFKSVSDLPLAVQPTARGSVITHTSQPCRDRHGKSWMAGVRTQSTFFKSFQKTLKRKESVHSLMAVQSGRHYHTGYFFSANRLHGIWKHCNRKSLMEIRQKHNMQINVLGIKEGLKKTGYTLFSGIFFKNASNVKNDCLGLMSCKIYAVRK